MILVAGGTGLLGRDVVARLVGRGVAVRVLSRDPARARSGLGTLADQVELVAGDVRDPATLPKAIAGCETVVAAVQGFGGHDAGGLTAVDRDGNVHLIEAAAGAGVRRFVLVSIHGASPRDSLPLGRAKAAAEAALRATAMDWTMVRPSAYMETWAGIVGGPILESGKARVFGRGRNPINFVAAQDVAPIVAEVAVANDEPGRSIEIVGPEDLSFDTVVERFAAALERPVPIAHVPLLVLRAMAVGLRPIKPLLADQAAAAVVLDTTDRRAGSAPTGDGTSMARGATTFDTVIRTMVAAASRADGHPPQA